jgi:hypothetical protein
MNLPGELDQTGNANSLTWERWPLQEDPRRLARLGLLGLLGGLVGAVLVASLPLTAAVALGMAMAVAVLPYLMPRRFRLTPEGLSIRQGFYTTRRVWADFEAFQPVKAGYLFQIRLDIKSKPNRPNLLLPDTTKLFLPFPLEPEKAVALEQALASYMVELKTGTAAS